MTSTLLDAQEARGREWGLPGADLKTGTDRVREAVSALDVPLQSQIINLLKISRKSSA